MVLAMQALVLPMGPAFAFGAHPTATVLQKNHFHDVILFNYGLLVTTGKSSLP